MNMSEEKLMDDETRKGVMFWMHGPDIAIIDAMKRRYGCTTTAAIRACIRIASDVKLKLEREPPTNGA